VLLAWFGRVPRFHDAELLEITLASKGESVLRIHTWEMTNQVDDRGYFVLDKHVVVTITLHSVTEISLSDFDLPGIIGSLEVTSQDGVLPARMGWILWRQRDAERKANADGAQTRQALNSSPPRKRGSRAGASSLALGSRFRAGLSGES